MMKGFKGISLRVRLTLLTAAVMILVAVALTVSSISRADAYFVPDNYMVKLIDSAPIVKSNEVSLEGANELTAAKNAAESTPIDVRVSTTQSIADFNIKVSAEDTQARIVPLEEVSLYAVNASQAAADTAAITVGAAAEGSASAEAFKLETMTLTVAAKKKFAFSSTWMMFAAMLAGSVLTWFMAGRALKPLKTLAGAIDTIDAHNLSARIENIQTNDEVRHLADNFNHMLDKLEQAFEQQRTFSANAARELKTPLAAIRTNLEVLAMEEEPTPKDYQETLEVIGRNTDRLIGLVSGLLELNDQQNMDLHESISTEVLLTQLLDEQAAAIAEKHLEVCIDNQLTQLYANRQLLTSALGNLLDNAIKYQQEGGKIVLTLCSQSDNAVIKVWDDGPGIASEQLPHIFEPFYRCDRSRSSKISGSGLGLSLVHTIVQRHGGTINVQSAPEDGTTFTITLPGQVL